MKQFIRFVKHIYYKFFTPYRGMYRQQTLGKYRVQYSCGRKSVKMDYETAKDYAEMFNGKVVKDF